jgi:hypothetical protein
MHARPAVSAVTAADSGPPTPARPEVFSAVPVRGRLAAAATAAASPGTPAWLRTVAALEPARLEVLRAIPVRGGPTVASAAVAARASPPVPARPELHPVAVLEADFDLHLGDRVDPHRDAWEVWPVITPPARADAGRPDRSHRPHRRHVRPPPLSLSTEAPEDHRDMRNG